MTKTGKGQQETNLQAMGRMLAVPADRATAVWAFNKIWALKKEIARLKKKLKSGGERAEDG